MGKSDQAIRWGAETRIGRHNYRSGVVDVCGHSERTAAIDAAFSKFGFDPSNAADVLAIRAYVWAQHYAPMNYYPPKTKLDVPWGGPQLEFVSQSIMALELARPGTLSLAMNGDAASKKYLDFAVEDGMQNGGDIGEPRPASIFACCASDNLRGSALQRSTPDKRSNAGAPSSFPPMCGKNAFGYYNARASRQVGSKISRSILLNCPRMRDTGEFVWRAEV